MAAAAAIPWITAAVSAAGVAMQAKSAHDANKQRKQSIANMMAIRGQATNEVSQDIEQQAAGYDPLVRREKEAEFRSEDEARMVNDLQAALASPTKSVPVGRTDPQLATRDAANKAAEAERQIKNIRLFSAVQAPNSQRFFESLNAADAASRRNTINAAARSALQTGGAAYNSIQPNSVLTTAGGLVQGAGQAYGQHQSAQAFADAFKPAQPNPYALYGHT